MQTRCSFTKEAVDAGTLAGQARMKKNDEEK
jgi:hypothetical protein